MIKFKNYAVLSRQAPNTLTFRDKTQHARRRRVVSQAFSDSSLRLFEPKILSKVDQFCKILRERQQNPAGVRDWTDAIDMGRECKYK